MTTNSIIYHLKKGAGFFSEFFFMVNHYIYCKKENIPFNLNTEHWLFKSKEGWTDYFKTIENQNNTKTDEPQQYSFGHIIENYNIEEYKDAIKEIYRYNDSIQNKITYTMNLLDLTPNTYASIFIRRGDKLLYESKLYETELYIEKLLQLCPDCKNIFIQTDDYQCILDIEKYIKSNNLDKIQIKTICKPDMRGIFIDNNNSDIQSNIDKNKHYINAIKPNISTYKTVHQMDSNEIFEHTCDMLIGIDILLQSTYCILDYQSNVSRFIKLAHQNPLNVYDIDNYYMDMQSNICPAYPESVYKDPDTFRKG